MSKTKQLKLKTNFAAWKWEERGICSMEVYEEEDGKKEIILCNPEGIEYLGMSPTNFYEHFASDIKKHLLPDVLNSDITWIDRHIYRDPEAFPTIELKVLMDFNNGEYSNPKWVKRS